MAKGEDLALLGRDVDLLGWLTAQHGRRPRAAPRSPRSSARARRSPRATLHSASRIAAPRRSGDISSRNASARSAGLAGPTAVRFRAVRHPISQNTAPVSLARASWITVVVVCAIAAVLFAISGYTGYTATVSAVGLAAAVNLLPSPIAMQLLVSPARAHRRS